MSKVRLKQILATDIADFSVVQRSGTAFIGLANVNTGAGTANTLPKFSGTTTLTDSIARSPDINSFHIGAGTEGNTNLYIQNSTGIATTDGLRLRMGSGTTSNAEILNQENGKLFLGSNSVQAVQIDASGQVGLGFLSTITSTGLEVSHGTLAQRSTVSDAATTTQPDILKLRHLSSAAMADNFGASILFQHEDDAGGPQGVCRVSTKRVDGEDNTAKLGILLAKAGTLTERLTLLPSGDVGFSESSPDSFKSETTAVVAKGSTSTQLSLVGSRTGDGNIGQVAWYNAALPPGEKRLANIEVARSGGNDSGLIRFSTMDTGTLAVRMRISPAGKVGIGTAAAASELLVVGDDVPSLATSGSTSVVVIGEASGSLASRQFWAQDANNYGEILYSPTNSAFIIRAKFAGSLGTHLSLTSGGDVGVGHLAPDTCLHLKRTTVSADVRSETTLTTGFAGFSAISETNRILRAQVHGSAATGSIFGITKTNYAELTASGANILGILFGTVTSDPIIVGTNDLVTPG